MLDFHRDAQGLTPHPVGVEKLCTPASCAFHWHQRWCAAWLQGITECVWGEPRSAEREKRECQKQALGTPEIHNKWESSVWENASQSAVAFTLCMLRMKENPNTAALLHQVLGGKKGRKQHLETTKSTSRQRCKSSRNLVLQFHKEVWVTGLEEHTKTVLEKDFIQLHKFTVFWRSLDHP